jgi:hypothetical protein
MRCPATNIMVALLSGVRSPSIKPFTNAVMRTIPAWLAKMKQVPKRRPQRIFYEFRCWDIRRFDAAALEEL